MNPLIDVEILRVFVGESAHHDGKPLHEVIVSEARKRGMAGASVMRGFMGFGANSLIHTAKILRLSEDLPVIVEIVDTSARIADFLPIVDGLVDEGTIVIEQAKAIFHLPMRIRDVMSANVVTAKPETLLSEVVELLLKEDVKALPVLNGAKIEGIITGGDLLQRADMPLRLDVQLHLPPELRMEHIQALDIGGLKARDVMTSPVHTLNIKTKVADALELMASRKLKRLPVVDDSGNLMGIVSRIDVLGAIGRAAALTEHLPALPQGLRRTAQDAMFKDVPTAGPATPLNEVLDKLLATPLRRVVVVDDARKVLGIILDRNLVALYAQRSKPGFLRTLVAALSGKSFRLDDITGVASDVMKPDAFTIRPGTPLADVVRLFLEKNAKRIVVTDEAGRLRGLVDRDTVLKQLAGY